MHRATHPGRGLIPVYGIRGVVASRLSGPFVLVSLILVFTLMSSFDHGDHGHDVPTRTAPDASVPAVVDPLLGDLQSIARWATYCGLAMVGALLFARLAAPDRRDNRRVLLLVVVGGLTCAVAALVELLVFGPIATGRGAAAVGDGTLLATTLGMTTGRLLVLQAVAALLLTQVAARVLSAVGPAYGWENLGMCLGLVLLIGVAANGHAGGHAPVALLPAVAHAAGMSLWFGSLLAAAVLPALRPGGTASGNSALLLSRVASWCLNVVLASGLVLAWQLVPTLDSLWTSDYGRTLLLKLAVIAVLLGIAAVARTLVHHHLRPNSIGGRLVAGVLGRVGSLKSVVVLELTLGACVLGLTAHLVSQSPPPA